MIQPITAVGAVVCLGVLVFRYRLQTKTSTRRTPQQQVNTAKVLLAALVAFMAVGYALEHLNENLSGVSTEPSLMERIVTFLK